MKDLRQAAGAIMRLVETLSDSVNMRRSNMFKVKL